ncbi:MAG TPA: glycosyltransferase family 2 protein [Patescibacteria group bacterium]|nr:glycosyltransferase family 2 protein [Patescibacteria group bacterium]
MKSVFISILDYNQKETTLACLASLEKIEHKGLQVNVIVIDNYPKGVLEIDTKKYKNISVILTKTPDNLGFSGGHNVGIDYAMKQNADYVIVLNNDVIVDRGLVQELVKAAESNERIGAVVPKIYFMAGNEYHKDRYKKSELGKVFWYAGGKFDWDNIQGQHIGVDEVDKGQYDNEGETDLLTGCCVLLTKAALRKVQGFDAAYFLYYEDADLNTRLKQAGFVIYYAPKAVLWHVNAGATGGSGSVLQDYFISRNRMRIGMRYARLRTKIALIRESLRILANGREWQKKGVIDYYLGRFGKGSYPV